MSDKEYLQLAIEEARKSAEAGGFPAGAVIVKDGEIIARSGSGKEGSNDPTAHAETSVIRKACEKLGTSNLKGVTMYESLQACLMCFSVANWAKISKIVFAAKKTQEMVSKGYYEGVTDEAKVNQENTHHIEVVHFSELEQESLQVVKEWEEQTD